MTPTDRPAGAVSDRERTRVAERATWRGMPRIVHPLITGYAEAGR